jgi:RNase H-fold protein (predicted Holliday junction resolvase)
MMNSKSAILGFDPGRQKCGLAVMASNRQLLYHQVVPAEGALATIQSLCQQFAVELVAIGDQTSAKAWFEQLAGNLPDRVRVVLVDERYSSLEARERYWQMYPPTGLARLIPKGMRVPPRPVDDIVAIVLIERYLAQMGLG